MLNRMTKPKEEKIDYLTPMRKLRDYKESLKGDYSVDFNKMKAKAKVLSTVVEKQAAFITHLKDDPYLSLLKENAQVNPKEVQKGSDKKQTKAKGKDATMKELE